MLLRSEIHMWVFLQEADFIHGSQCTYNVILLYAWVTIVAMETQSFPFYCCTYATVSNVINTEIVAMETEQLEFSVISLHISLPILSNILGLQKNCTIYLQNVNRTWRFSAAFP
jgi:hypothetical protein